MSFGLLGAAITLALPYTAVLPAEVTYGYCEASEPIYGRYYVMSTVFAVPAGTYHVGVANSFVAHVSAHDDRPVANPSCVVSFETRQQAADARNNVAASRRTGGLDIVFTRWSYGGD